MNRAIQIRNVSDKLHRRLKSRAALAGLSLSDYLLREINRFAEAPTVEELMQRVAQRTPVRPEESSAALIRAERDRK